MASLPFPNRTLADERQPSCSGCDRLGIPCPGLQKRTIFIQEHPNESRKEASKVLDNSSSMCLTTKAQALQTIDLNLPKEDHYTSLFVNKFNTVPVGDLNPLSFLHCGVFASNGNPSISYPFVQNLRQAFFGHYFALPQITMDAQKMYGRNLRLLMESLNMPEVVASEDTFRAILTAVIFEKITQPSSSAGAIHLVALAKIIQYVSDNTLQSPPFTSTHITNVHPSIQVPGLLEDYDNLCSSDVPPSATFSAVTRIRRQTVSLLNLLVAWRWDWERQNSDQVWAIPTPATSHMAHDPISGRPIYPFLFEFTNDACLMEMCCYNSILTLLLGLLSDVCDAAGDESIHLHTLSLSTPLDLIYPTQRSPLCLPSDPQFSSRNAAAEHIRCVEKALSKESHISSTGLTHVTGLNMTYKSLPVRDALRGWIERIYGYGSPNGSRQKMKDVHGRRIGFPTHPSFQWRKCLLPPSEG
ncbi:MAG: hypothetical protein Q9169_008176 [Polycauliona sp. 2 TL-2023]